jgi:hypothetical protein
VAAAGVAGCATQQSPAGTGGADAPADVVVAARSNERWQALIAGNMPKAYGFLSPASKSVYSLELYQSSIRLGFWKAVDVEKVDCAGDICEVSLALTYVYNGTTIKSPARESWIRENGVWWYMQKSQ